MSVSDRQQRKSDLASRYSGAIDRRRQSGQLRRLPDGPNADLDFTHNDYLGLCTRREIIDAAIEAAGRFGVGGRASRLLGAESAAVRELETVIAASKSSGGAGNCLVFASGYQLNAGVISTLLDPALLGETPIVLADRLIHASMHHGIRLAGVRQHRFAHNDMDDLERRLKKLCPQNLPVYVFVESLYGMDGDVAPLDKLYQLKNRYGFHLYVDEAHATGIEGTNGYGLAEQGPDKADIVIGTFSKAIGGSGGYLICDPEICELMVNFCGAFLYSTAINPISAAVALAAWNLIPQLSGERDHVRTLSANLREQLSAMNLDTGSSTTHIIPVIAGDVLAGKMKEHLQSAGIQVSLIRPPTVPRDTTRLRIGVSATHTKEDIGQLIRCLKEIA